MWLYRVSQRVTIPYLPFGVFVLFDAPVLGLLTVMTISLPFAAIYSAVIVPKRHRNQP